MEGRSRMACENQATWDMGASLALARGWLFSFSPLNVEKDTIAEMRVNKKANQGMIPNQRTGKKMSSMIQYSRDGRRTEVNVPVQRVNSERCCSFEECLCGNRDTIFPSPDLYALSAHRVRYWNLASEQRDGKEGEDVCVDRNRLSARST